MSRFRQLLTSALAAAALVALASPADAAKTFRGDCWHWKNADAAHQRRSMSLENRGEFALAEQEMVKARQAADLYYDCEIKRLQQPTWFPYDNSRKATAPEVIMNFGVLGTENPGNRGGQNARQQRQQKQRQRNQQRGRNQGKQQPGKNCHENPTTGEWHCE
jgi:hypothetical protein